MLYTSAIKNKKYPQNKVCLASYTHQNCFIYNYVDVQNNIAVINIKNGIGKASSNFSLFCCIHLCINTLRKGMNSFLFPPAIGK